jgi:alpha-L-rhamnosidase
LPTFGEDFMKIAKKHIGLMLSAMAIVWVGAQAQGALPPVNLRCGMRTNPLGIGDTSLRLSWQLQSTSQARGETQSAYQVQVGTSPGAADLWDSGKVTSPATLDVLYAGQPLLSGQLCYWQVRVFDGSNNVSAWSAPAQWSMGMLTQTNWTAQWIGYDAAYTPTPQQTANSTLFNASGINWVSSPGQTAQNGLHQSALRKKVVMPAGQTITNAIMALYADNMASVYVNGQQATNSSVRWEATARINVTSLMQTGTNLVAISATNTDSQEGARVIGRLVVQFASGSVSNIAVDTSWKAAQWPSGSWTQLSYDDSSWGTPDSGGSPWGTPALNEIARMPAPYLRKNFSVNQAVTRATVYVTALGAYELRLNGQKVSNDVLTPGWTQFTKRVYYQTYDVTGMVQGGSNTIGAILGDGWYASVIGFTGSRNNYGGVPRFLAQLVIELADGSRQTIASDASWKASYGPIRFGDMLIGSEYDARLELPGWDTTNYNDSAWSPVVTGLSTNALGYYDVTANLAARITNNHLNFVAANTNLGGDPAFGVVKTLEVYYRIGTTSYTNSYGENATVDINGNGQSLTIQLAYYGNASVFPDQGGFQVQAAVTEPARILETIAATNLTLPKPGCYTFDLGQNIVGWVRLQVSGSVGDRITVRHGEMLSPDGSVYAANLRGANSTDFFTFGTNGTTTFEPRFTFHGFRYVEVRGLTVPPTLNSVTGIVVHSDMPRTGSFSSSSSLLNQLYSNIIWGQKGNYLETATDCPQRDERLGWTGDTEFFTPTAAYNFDVQPFFRRHLVTLCEDSQHSDGSIANVAPQIGGGSGGTAWGDAAWICTYQIYRAYGDTNVIADHYAAMQRCGQFDAANANNYVISSLPGDFGDWLNLGGGATATVMDTAFYAYYAQAMSEMAAAIGKSADAATYSTLRSNIAAAFANFFSADGSFTDGSGQTGYALAFTLNLVPASLRAKVAQKFADSIAQYGNHLATGFIGTPRLLPALHLAGRDDLAYTVLLQDTYPSWLYQVKLGATTMWERWDGWTPTGGFQTIGMNSFNHYSFGAVGEYMYSAVGGISATTPGYRTIQIQPVPGYGLTWAATSLNSTRGFISTAWTNVGGLFNLDVVIPPNTTAQIFVPTTNAPAITESGILASNAPGVSFIASSNKYAIYAVGSGHYVWASPYQIPAVPGVVITTTNQTGTGSGTFIPSWTMTTNGSLIAGRSPSSVSGNFSLEAPGRSVYALSTSNNLALTLIAGTTANTTSTNYVTCGNGSGAGSYVIYSITNSPTGYDLTNITVYGGWADNGRDQQAYTVYYSTPLAPNTFSAIGVVNFNPSVASGIQSATRVTLTSTTGVLASNVAAVKFDFSSPSSENGYCGYGGITVFGTPSATLVAAPTLLTNTQPVTAATVVGDQMSFAAAFTGAQPIDYQWLVVRGGVTNAIPGAKTSTLLLTNLQLSDTGTYQLQASNSLGVSVSSASSLTVSSVPAPVNNVVTMLAAETGLGGGGTFIPTWTVSTNNSLIAGQSPSSSSGNFSLEVTGRSTAALTITNSLALTKISGSSGYPVTCSSNYVTCGNGNSAGSSLVYSLTGSSTGYNLTNITVYGGWADAGRDQQAYTLSYSTVAAPSTFTTLTSVNFNPVNPSSVQSATRATLVPGAGVLASNVAAVKFDFTTPSSENGYCGYGGITLSGFPVRIPPATNPTNITFQLCSNTLILGWPSDHIGWRLQVQTNGWLQGLSTNWMDVVGSTTTDQVFMAINPLIGSAFYRLTYP